MKCRKCQCENPAGLKFCGECGAKLELVCPSCSAPNPSHFKFCGECGHSLTSPEHGRTAKDLSFDEKLARIQEYLPLRKAESMFQQMGMDYWLGKAQEALARL